jgi:hypothetical protein
MKAQTTELNRPDLNELRPARCLGIDQKQTVDK